MSEASEKKYMHPDNKRFEICFDRQCPIFNTSEKPDWYILDKYCNKVLIGMNHFDLSSSGRRPNNYFSVHTTINSENIKLLFVLCNIIRCHSDKTNLFKLFQVGFTNNTLCYIKNLPNIINDYFI